MRPSTATSTYPRRVSFEGEPTTSRTDSGDAGARRDPRAAMRATWRDTARAFVLTTLLVAFVVDAFPEHVPTRSELAEPATRARLDGLARLGATLGVASSTDEVADAIVEAQTKLLRTKSALLAPIRPVLSTLRLAQQWTMFANVDRVVDRLVVEIGTGHGESRVLFRAGDPEHQELADLLLDRRVSALWHVPLGGVAPELVRVVDAIEARVFAAHPEARVLVVRVEGVSIDGGEPELRFGTARVRSTAAHRDPRDGAMR